MLGIYSAILFILLAGHQTESIPTENHNTITHFSERLAKIIEQHCLNYANETKANEAVEALNDFIKCWVIALPEKKVIGGARYEYCIEETEKFTKCLNSFVNKISPCLHPEEYYLKSFILDSYGNYNHHFCKLFELLSVSEEAKKNSDLCSTRFSQNPKTDPLVACYKNSTIFGDGQNSNANIVLKPKLCADILNIRNCYDNIFAQHCPNARALKDLLRTLLTQGLTNCSDELNETTEKITKTNHV